MQYNTSCAHIGIDMSQFTNLAMNWGIPILRPNPTDYGSTGVLRDCGSKKSDPPHPQKLVVSHLDVSRNRPSILGWQSFWPVIPIILYHIRILSTWYSYLLNQLNYVNLPYFLGEKSVPWKPWTPWAEMAWTRPTCRKRRATHPHSWSSSCNLGFA